MLSVTWVMRNVFSEGLAWGVHENEYRRPAGAKGVIYQ
jgi:hypothetical protein